MNPQPSVDRGRLAAGLVLIALGVLFTLDEFRLLDLGAVWQFWPTILIGLGLYQLLRPEPGKRGSGLWLLLIGAWLQVNTLKALDLSYGDTWPILLILIGAAILVRPLLEGPAAAPPK